jgi:hypothetical protein
MVQANGIRKSPLIPVVMTAPPPSMVIPSVVVLGVRSPGSEKLPSLSRYVSGLPPGKTIPLPSGVVNAPSESR